MTLRGAVVAAGRRRSLALGLVVASELTATPLAWKNGGASSSADTRIVLGARTSVGCAMPSGPRVARRGMVRSTGCAVHRDGGMYRKHLLAGQALGLAAATISSAIGDVPP